MLGRRGGKAGLRRVLNPFAGERPRPSCCGLIADGGDTARVTAAATGGMATSSNSSVPVVARSAG